MSFEKYLRQEQIKKDATEAASKSVNDIVGKMMREKEYSEWMGKQGFDVLRHANCCKIAFNGGWESRQTEVDELQKRVDAAQKLLEKWKTTGLNGTSDYAVGGAHARQNCEDELEQALKGEQP